MENNSTIKCPHCGGPVNVSDVLQKQMQEQLKHEFNQKLAEKEQQFSAKELAFVQKEKQLQQQAADITRQQEDINARVEASLKLKLSAEKEKLEKSIKLQLQEENTESMKSMQRELSEKSEKLRELNQARIDLERLKREKDELRDTISLEKERELTEQLKSETLKIKQRVEEENVQKMEELRKQLKDQKELAEEMKRKAEQGSMQLQGEVQELAIEEWLCTQFPLDTIEEIKKGQLGADCVQTIHTRSGQNLGKICYESKNTKAFGGDWISKLKEDMLRANANVGVLVTQVYPKNIDRMALVDGVWICSFDEFKGLCNVLRQGIIQVSLAMATQENKGDKMVMLYDYLTGNEFRAQVEAIVEGFTEMRTRLHKERIAALKNFAEREKMIDKVVLNTVTMYGSVKGIAGSAVQEIKMLETDSDEDEAE